jgi:hypothetical protein
MRELIQGDLPTDGSRESAAPCVTERMRVSHRDPEDDFFCLRFEVWYSSHDCAVRTKFRTCAGCLNCEQGRFNLKRHASSLRTLRFPVVET